MNAPQNIIAKIRTSAALGLMAGLGVAAASASAETIVVRSGQVGGVPGAVGQFDDIVRYLPTNPPGGAVSASPFTAADFSGAQTGPAAQVIAPYTPFWTAGISDTQARWINFRTDAAGYGAPGSALYAIPFTVTTANIASATIQIELAVDDALGDWFVSGPNPDGMYVNGVSTGATTAYNYASPTISSILNITTSVNTGLNWLYLYQRDLGVLVSGVIFSATIEVTAVPLPGPAGMAGVGMMALAVRRPTRRR